MTYTPTTGEAIAYLIKQLDWTWDDIKEAAQALLDEDDEITIKGIVNHADFDTLMGGIREQKETDLLEWIQENCYIEHDKDDETSTIIWA